MGRLSDGFETAVENLKKRKKASVKQTHAGLSLSKNPELAAVARKQRFAARHAIRRGGLWTAVALRAVLVLGAAHP